MKMLSVIEAEHFWMPTMLQPLFKRLTAIITNFRIFIHGTGPDALIILPC